MFIKIVSTLAVFTLISPSQAGFSEDLKAFLTPWIDGLLSAMPLVRLKVNEIRFMQNETMGMDPAVLEPIHQDTHKKLVQLESQLKSRESKACVKDLAAMLVIATDKFRTDGSCFKRQQNLAESIVLPLVNSIFPVKPTPACPIPILCKIDLLSYNPRSLRQAVGAMKDVHKHGVNLLKFIVYFKKNITECRRDVSLYNAMVRSLLKLAQVCVKM